MFVEEFAVDNRYMSSCTATLLTCFQNIHEEYDEPTQAFNKKIFL